MGRRPTELRNKSELEQVFGGYLLQWSANIGGLVSAVGIAGQEPH